MPIIQCLRIDSIDDTHYAQLQQAVSAKRRKRAERFRFAKDAKRCICAEWLLQYGFYQATGSKRELEIAYHEFGKPFIKPSPMQAGVSFTAAKNTENDTKHNTENNFCYNVSHSGDWVVLAYANSEIGVDIEKIQTDKDRIAERFFAKEEWEFINAAVSLQERDERFTQIWTLKESYVKYLGRGLSMDLTSFAMLVEKEGIRVREERGQVREDLYFESWLFADGYVLSVCSEVGEGAVAVQEVFLNADKQSPTSSPKRAKWGQGDMLVKITF